MNHVLIDCEGMEEGARRALEVALSEAVDSDMPLLLELLFVSEEEIRALNARTRGVDRVTDVLSFPTMELKPGEPVSSELHGECVDGDVLCIGSVVICSQRAREQAAEYGHSVERETGYLTVHGFFHCLGYDHETEEERAAMRVREEEVMARLGLGRDA